MHCCVITPERSNACLHNNEATTALNRTTLEGIPHLHIKCFKAFMRQKDFNRNMFEKTVSAKQQPKFKNDSSFVEVG